MSKGEVTREIVLDAALTQAVVEGLDGLSINAVAAAAGLSKSGLFAHFRSKTELQLAVLDASARLFETSVVHPAYRVAQGRPRLECLFSGYLDWMERGSGGGGCLLVSAVQEYDDRPGAIRDRLVEIASAWRDVIRRILSEGAMGSTPSKACDRDQQTFEFIGLALAFQQSCKLLGDADARSRASRGLDRLFDSANAGACARLADRDMADA